MIVPIFRTQDDFWIGNVPSLIYNKRIDANGWNHTPSQRMKNFGDIGTLRARADEWVATVGGSGKIFKGRSGVIVFTHILRFGADGAANQLPEDKDGLLEGTPSVVAETRAENDCFQEIDELVDKMREVYRHEIFQAAFKVARALTASVMFGSSPKTHQLHYASLQQASQLCRSAANLYIFIISSRLPWACGSSTMQIQLQ